MNETFGIGSFRSRQQVMRFDAVLRRAGIRAQIVSTPRDVAVGCGLSVRFEIGDWPQVSAVYKQNQMSNLIGFYSVTRNGTGRPTVVPLR